ncbi:flagellar basal body-associated FliL family protein [Vibrio mimicus]|uniref:flagellar basal body-associated FliL family protein n=1 Tax=Vibrio mimicus TaxID=674 RepID=UPI0011DBFA6D|nr:flagellar basal body-associated FliL family protein [Vibrio mimicus]TXY26090.1 flagellar basal body-associated FliL family protein [Vibrio mimicus]
MTKQHMIAIFFAMIITSALVSAGTLVSGIWYLKKEASSLEQEVVGSSLPFLSDEETNNNPSFYPLDKVVLTIKGKKQTHYVMLELAVETRRPDRIKNIDNYMPLVKNSLLQLFSDKTFDELQQSGAINSLQNEIKQTLLNVFATTGVVRDIDDILLTKYVIQ